MYKLLPESVCPEYIQPDGGRRASGVSGVGPMLSMAKARLSSASGGGSVHQTSTGMSAKPSVYGVPSVTHKQSSVQHRPTTGRTWKRIGGAQTTRRGCIHNWHAGGLTMYARAVVRTGEDQRPKDWHLWALCRSSSMQRMVTASHVRLCFWSTQGLSCTIEPGVRLSPYPSDGVGHLEPPAGYRIRWGSPRARLWSRWSSAAACAHQ